MAEVEGLQLRVAEGVTGQGAQPEDMKIYLQHIYYLAFISIYYCG